jgi:hypothetical protein
MTVKLDCGCILKNAENYTDQDIAVGVKIECPVGQMLCCVVEIIS